MQKKILIVWLLCASLTFSPRAEAKKGVWRRLDKGLFLASFEGKTASESSYDIYILKINPSFYSLVLLMSSKEGISPLTLREWVYRYHLIAAINASMFWKDYLTSTGYMRSHGYINQRRIHKKFGGFFVFGPRKKGMPFAQIIEKQEKGWKDILGKYECVVQSFRMISKDRKNLWKEQGPSYSVSAIGIDKLYNVLFIFSLDPISIYELNELLLSFPINIKSCIFTEGGSTAGIYIKIKSFEKGISGYNRFNLLEGKDFFRKVPNIIGVIPKEERKK